VLGRKALEEILGCDAGPGGEKPMKVKWAQSNACRQVSQTGLFRVMLVQMPNDTGNAFVVVHAPNMASWNTLSHPILAVIF
jgi:hypothetical protein